jgi:hypothetical protein
VREGGGRRTHEAELLELLGVERAGEALDEDAGETDDRVERGAQLVAHCGEKLGLEAVELAQAGVGGSALGEELLELAALMAQAVLGAAPCGDVLDDAADLHDGTGFAVGLAGGSDPERDVRGGDEWQLEIETGAVRAEAAQGRGDLGQYLRFVEGGEGLTVGI